MPTRTTERAPQTATAADTLVRKAYEAQVEKQRATTRLFINDVTLRDGEQAPGNTMSEEEKLELAKQLVLMGMAGIEAGFPIASPGDFRAVERIANEVGPRKLPRPSHESEHPRISGLARLTYRKDIEAVLNSVKGAPHHGIHVFISTSEDQIDKFAKPIREAGGNPDSLSDHINKIVIPGIEEQIPEIRKQDPNAIIQFSPEDWTRTEESVSDEVILAAAQMGTHVINLPDTVGIAVPMQIVKRVAHVRQLLDKNGFQHVMISWHGHNDTGNGVANAHAALEAGAQQFESTILGIGERTGNFSFEGFLAGLDANLRYYEEATGKRITDPIVRKQVMKTALLLSSILGKEIPPEHPIVGENAFAHEAGIHQNGQLKAKKSGRKAYEVLVPERYGAKSKLVIGKHSGWGGIREYLIQNNLPFREEDRQRFTDIVSSTADRLQRRKGLSDSEVMREAYFPTVIDITGGSIIDRIEATTVPGDDHCEQVRAWINPDHPLHEQFPGGYIDGTSDDETEGFTNAGKNALRQIVEGFEVEDYSSQMVKGEDVRGGSAAPAETTMTVKNGRTVEMTGQARRTLEAELVALTNAFNALAATERYAEMDSEAQE